MERILLISPNFFSYPKIISEQLEEMGYQVDWFDDRPSTNSFVKAIIRINRNILNIFISKYFNRILKYTNNKKYCKIIIISGQSFSFSEKMIAQLKKQHAKAEWILYQWDSTFNFPYINNFYKFFDRCYSFDRKDAEVNSSLIFLPLFYGKQYSEIGKILNDEFKYDYFFIGTAHPKKYKFINEINKELSKLNYNGFIYFYFPSRIVYYYRKFKNKEFKYAKKREFNFKPLNGNEIKKIYINSKCVLDSSQDNQIGLTIRVIEALGAKKKIITTNKDIVNYDFYKPQNVYVYNGKIDTDNVFFKEPYVEIDIDIYRKYSLESWLSIIVGNNR